ncbi:hypothetical protein FQA39_LY16890 [Lamprigera yunnana]|nr:hypothetical protein FQA39_LY16890 [Lamprigera yunnana]
MKEKNCVSLDCGRYQKWKALAPQIFAVLLTASLHIFVGRYLTFGSLLAHQLEKEKVPKNVWLDNVPTCISLAGGVLAGVVVDVVGRLKTVKFSVVPGVLGSVLIATAQSVWILILGRALTTISFMLISTSTVVYISEISDSKLRGAFLSLVLVFVSFGTFVEHIEGSFLRFSIISWISIFYLVCPIVPLRYVHESPPWLVSKKRLDEAKLSCQWFNQFALLDEQKINTLAEFEVATLEDEQIELFENASYFASYFRSIFYKPFFSVLGVSLFQQLSGTIITVSHLSETYDATQAMVALEETEKDTGLRKYMLLLPQAWASVLITSFHLMVGEIMAYSAVVVPQLMDDQSLITNSTVHITGSDIAWIVSAPVLTASLTCVVAGVLVDYIGRLKIIIFSAIPAAISSILIASATNVSMIVWGRIISGICLTFISTSTTVYVSEISRPDVRGSFLSLLQPFVSTGLILVYLKGWLMNWRMIALLINAYALIPIVVVLFIPESPAWLVSKGRIAQARKSLRFFYRYHSEKSDLVEEELKNIIEEQMQKREQRFELKKHLQLFLLPTFYKPFLILCATFFFQQFSGIFAIITYCIIFFKQIGSSIDPYLASICTAGVKLVMSVMVTVLMKKFNRRPLYIFGASGMAVSIALSGLNTQWIQRGTVLLI